MPVERGPKDLRQLPEYFGSNRRPSDYGAYDIEIIAEINHCPRLALDRLLHTAADLVRDGADIIDIGCEPGETWSGVAAAVGALVAEGYRVSIDSLDPREIDADVAAALGQLVDHGVPLLNQAVLLRGVNDSVEVLAELCRSLVDLRVMPYYLHQLDRVRGARHFEVPDREGVQLVDRLRQLLPGYAVPRYVQEVAGGYRLVTRPQFAEWVAALRAAGAGPRLTQAALETLSIIAYRQPVTRAELESIRGVTVEGVLKTLVERDLVRIAGRAEGMGRPLLYGTTDHFLE